MSFDKKSGIGGQSGPDLLDKVMMALGVVAGAAGAGAAMGYGAPIAGVLGVLAAAAYLKAPSRSFPTAEAIAGDTDLAGKVAIVTGPTSGIGTETARVLALRGAHVILASRSKTKLAASKQEIEESLARKGVKAKLTALQLELSDLSSVRQFAEDFRAMDLPLHLLVNNAGVMALRERRPTEQGLEQQVGINHVGHFYLTMLLTPNLKASSSPKNKSRVVCLSSMAYRLARPQFFDPGNVDLETAPYDQWAAYGNAKLSNMLFAKEFNARFAGEGVEACSVMPGGIHTGLQGEVSWWTAIKWRVVTPFFFKSIEQGAATTVFAALRADLSKEENGGQYFNDCKATQVAAGMPQDAATWLWTATEEKLKTLGFAGFGLNELVNTD